MYLGVGLDNKAMHFIVLLRVVLSHFFAVNYSCVKSFLPFYCPSVAVLYVRMLELCAVLQLSSFFVRLITVRSCDVVCCVRATFLVAATQRCLHILACKMKSA